MNDELVDICFNFTHDAFRPDEQEVLARAIDAGVTTLIVTGSSVEESRYGIELAKRYPQHLYATVGIHPHLSKEWSPDIQKQLRVMAREKIVKAIGEAGLDYNRDYSPRNVQRYAFEQQINLACELELPLFLHERDAHEDFFHILSPYRDSLTNVVLHCFTGMSEQLECYLDLDLHIGVTGWICDERRGLHLQQLVSQIPLNRLMIETDAPYLLPRDMKPRPKGRRNEPSFLPHILNTVATCLGLDTATVADATTRNAHEFFHLR